MPNAGGEAAQELTVERRSGFVPAQFVAPRGYDEAAVDVYSPGAGVQPPASVDDENAVLRAENERLRAENRELRLSIGRLAADELIPGILSPQGLTEMLRHAPDLINELLDEEYGQIWIDGRGIKALNDESFAHGNEMLRLIAERYLEHSLRTGDIITRRGDDFVAIVRSVSLEELRSVADRIAKSLSLDRAMSDIKNQAVPVLASVSCVHVSEIKHAVPRTLDDVLATINLLGTEASARNVPPKHAQYTQMWRLLGRRGRQPKDERRIADLFFDKFCPYFIEQIEELMKVRKQTLTEGSSYDGSNAVRAVILATDSI